METLLTLLLFWFFMSVLTKRLIPGPGPYVSRFCRWLGRGAWRHGFKNQYDRRGFLPAAGHTMTVLSGFATLGAILNPEADMWGAVALWWGVTLAYWFLIKQWQRLKQRKRQLPRRRRWYH